MCTPAHSRLEPPHRRAVWQVLKSRPSAADTQPCSSRGTRSLPVRLSTRGVHASASRCRAAVRLARSFVRAAGAYSGAQPRHACMPAPALSHAALLHCCLCDCRLFESCTSFTRHDDAQVRPASSLQCDSAKPTTLVVTKMPGRMQSAEMHD